MPCHDSRDDGFNYTKAMAKMEFQADLDKLTRMLCNLLKNVEPIPKKKVGTKGFWPNPFSEGRNGGYLETTVDEETMQWWEEHKKLDEQRKTKEKKKR